MQHAVMYQWGNDVIFITVLWQKVFFMRFVNLTYII